jgi:uncharacterized protein with PIN domain
MGGTLTMARRSAKYRRREHLRRYLSPKERREFVCNNKVTFVSRDQALEKQPSQSAYLCKVCGWWHLSSR